MIGRLRGELVAKKVPTLLVDAGGVGYEVEAPLSTFYKLPESGAQVQLYVHLVVREDAQLLYGFLEERERNLFRTLIRVNGVGPKLALAILSGIEADAFVQCVRDRNSDSLVRLPGIGKKTAERLIVEMADRLGEWGGGEPVRASGVTPASESRRELIRDAEAALIALGYKPQDAARAISRVDDEELGVEELIRSALKGLG